MSQDLLMREGDIYLLSGQSSDTARVLADLFAGRNDLQGEDRYRGGKWITLSTDGPAILEDALAGAESVVEVILLRHGHAIVIDQVRTILLHADGRPLVYWQAPIVTSTRRNMSARTRRSPS